jgi:hypothetical protein
MILPESLLFPAGRDFNGGPHSAVQACGAVEFPGNRLIIAGAGKVDHFGRLGRKHCQGGPEKQQEKKGAHGGKFISFEVRTFSGKNQQMNRLLYAFLVPALIWMIHSCQKPPNVILIMADDLGAECLPAYGGISYHTPHLDRLAAEGLTVSHCIAQPLCTPSRVKLMTGMENRRNYQYFGYLDTAWLNMGTVMKEAGYRTCICGKWQLNGLAYPEQIHDWNDPDRPHQMGYEEYCLWQLTHTRAEGERYAQPLIERNGTRMETGPDD